MVAANIWQSIARVPVGICVSLSLDPRSLQSQISGPDLAIPVSAPIGSWVVLEAHSWENWRALSSNQHIYSCQTVVHIENKTHLGSLALLPKFDIKTFGRTVLGVHSQAVIPRFTLAIWEGENVRRRGLEHVTEFLCQSI